MAERIQRAENRGEDMNFDTMTFWEVSAIYHAAGWELVCRAWWVLAVALVGVWVVGRRV